MCILCSERDGRSEAVMEFVDWCVEVGVVQEAVEMPEHNFADEDAGWELPQYGCECWEGGRDYVAA